MNDETKSHVNMSTIRFTKNRASVQSAKKPTGCWTDLLYVPAKCQVVGKE